MKKILFVVTALLLTLPAWAQKMKVRKVKGNQAVIEFSGASLRPGSVYEISGEDSFGTPDDSPARHRLLGLSFALTSGKSSAAGSDSATEIHLDGRYGWNFGRFELGPLFSYSAIPNGPNTVSTFSGGAFADFNLIPNLAGEPFIYGIGGVGKYGSRDSGSGNTTTLMTAAGGGFVKWFMVPQFAFRIDGFYEFTKYSGNAADTTYTGLLLQVGIANYF